MGYTPALIIRDKTQLILNAFCISHTVSGGNIKTAPVPRSLARNALNSLVSDEFVARRAKIGIIKADETGDRWTISIRVDSPDIVFDKVFVDRHYSQILSEAPI